MFFVKYFPMGQVFLLQDIFTVKLKGYATQGTKPFKQGLFEIQKMAKRNLSLFHKNR